MKRNILPISTPSLLKGLLLSLSFSWFASNSAYGQTPQQAASRSLEAAGFEQIRLRSQGDTILVALESPQIRGSYRALGIALRNLSQSFPNARHYSLLLGEYGQPQIAIEATNEANHWQVRAHYDTHTTWQQLTEGAAQTTLKANHQRKIDITLYPIVSIDNHTLWRGNRLIFQPILPVFTNIPDNNPESQFQWGVVGIRQDWFANRRWRASSTAGLFLYDLAGLHQEVNYHLTSTLDLGLRLSATTRVRRNSGRWERDRKLHIGAMAVADYYEPRTALQVKLSAGSFAYGDLGGRVDVIRHFGEYAIGAYTIFTDGERNAACDCPNTFHGNTACSTITATHLNIWA